jgi:hypothetical protein
MSDIQNRASEVSSEVTCPNCNNAVSPETLFCPKCGLGLPRGALQIDIFVEKLLDKKIRDRLTNQNVVVTEMSERVYERANERAKKATIFVFSVFGVASTIVLTGFGLVGFNLSQTISEKLRDIEKVAVADINKKIADGQSRLQSSLKEVESLNGNVVSGAEQIAQVQAQLHKIEDETKEIQDKIKKDFQTKIASIDTQLQDVTRQQKVFDDNLQDLRALSFREILPRYIKYLETIGFLHLDQAVKVVPYSEEAPLPKDVGPSNVANAMYKGDTLYIHQDLLADQSIAVREYTERALQRTLGDARASRAVSEIESALADYFTASFFNSPRIGGEVAAKKVNRSTPYIRTLDVDDGKDNTKKRLARSGDSENGEVWGRAFWQCRNDLGRDVVDRILFQAWAKAAPPNDSVDALKGFSKSVVNSGGAGHDERSAKCFTLQFQKRDLPL